MEKFLGGVEKKQGVIGQGKITEGSLEVIRKRMQLTNHGDRGTSKLAAVAKGGGKFCMPVAAKVFKRLLIAAL